MRLEPSLLEDYLRDAYFTSSYDLGSSGVESWTLGELLEVVGLDVTTLLPLRLEDTPSFGSAGVRDAVARRFGADPARVMVTHGASEALFLVMNALLDRGDEVVTVWPAYHALWQIAAAIGCRLVEWPLHSTDGFAPSVDELRRLVTPRTRLVVANFPHNPTGATIDARQQAELVDVCARVGAWLVWDASFAELVYDTEPLPDPSQGYERALTVGTLSKAYGLPGLRVGWCVAAPDLLPDLLPLRDRVTLCLSPLVETVAAAVLDRADELVKPRLDQARHNLDLLRQWAGERTELIEPIRVRGGVTAFPQLHVPDVDALCRRLATEDGVFLVPGSCFGDASRVRLGFGGRTELFAEGLNRLGIALSR